MEQIKALLQQKNALRWLFYGDSITHGAKHTCGKRDFSEHFRERLLWEMQRNNDLVLNSAFSGYKTADLLRDFDFRAAAFKPHVAFVMIGTNDSATKIDLPEYQAQLNELLDKFAGIDCRVILQTPPPVLCDLDPARTRVPEFAEAVRQVAMERNVPLIDHFKAWNESPAAFYLYSDILHPNDRGHIKIAQDIFKALDIFEPENSWVCKFFAPDTW